MVDPILKNDVSTDTNRIWFRVPVTVKPDADLRRSQAPSFAEPYRAID